jgi:hypothetical protein
MLKERWTWWTFGTERWIKEAEVKSRDVANVRSHLEGQHHKRYRWDLHSGFRPKGPFDCLAWANGPGTATILAKA